MSRLIRYLRGSVRFRLTGAAPEQCLNALAAARLEFWDIEREDALHLSLSVPARESERLQRLALRCLCTAEVTEHSGLRAQFGGLLRRPVLLLRIPCPFLGAVRLADLPCVWGVQLGDRRIVVVSDGSAHGGVQGHAVRGAFIQDATRERMRLALLGMHHSVLPSSHRMTDRHSPAGTALPGSAVFSARAPQIKQRKAAATKQDAGQQQDRPEAGRHKIAFQACMQRAIPVHETDRMQAGEYS